MKDFLRFSYIEGFIESDLPHTVLNLVCWSITLLLSLFMYSCADFATGKGGIIESTYVTSINFIPKHNQLIGKVIVIVEDEWMVYLDNNVMCESPVDYFSVGDSVEVSYTKGGLSDSKYCDKIKKTQNKEGI